MKLLEIQEYQVPERATIKWMENLGQKIIRSLGDWIEVTYKSSHFIMDPKDHKLFYVKLYLDYSVKRNPVTGKIMDRIITELHKKPNHDNEFIRNESTKLSVVSNSYITKIVMNLLDQHRETCPMEIINVDDVVNIDQLGTPLHATTFSHRTYYTVNMKKRLVMLLPLRKRKAIK